LPTASTPSTRRGAVTLTVFCSTDEQATWQRAPVAAMAEPGYDGTFEDSFPSSSPGTVATSIRSRTFRADPRFYPAGVYFLREDG
jgi:hypothetical protein